jgi:hypothetical protein
MRDKILATLYLVTLTVALYILAPGVIIGVAIVVAAVILVCGFIWSVETLTN